MAEGSDTWTLCLTILSIGKSNKRTSEMGHDVNLRRVLAQRKSHLIRSSSYVVIRESLSFLVGFDTSNPSNEN